MAESHDEITFYQAKERVQGAHNEESKEEASLSTEASVIHTTASQLVPRCSIFKSFPPDHPVEVQISNSESLS